MNTMTMTTKNYSIAFLVLFACQVFAQQPSAIKTDKTVGAEAIEIILGDWSGRLTYMDYSSNTPYTMPAEVTVVRSKTKNKWSLNFKYPNEPKANSKGQILISKQGDKINKARIVSKQVLSNKQIEIITEYKGRDNKKKALIRNTYIFGPKTFVIRKDVKFENSSEWIMRNTYSFER